MDLFKLPAPEVSVALRALKTVAMASGGFAEPERALLRAAARAYGAPDPLDLDALAPIAPAELAAAVPEGDDRRLVLQACMLMSLADESASLEEVRVLEEFRAALGLADDYLRVIHRLATGQRRLARLEAVRRAAAPMLGEAYARQGWRGVLQMFAVVPKVTGVEDPKVAWRYRKLGLLPDGTLGREYWKHVTEREFPLPGEGLIPESLVHHDLTHVLTGFDTDPDGELQVGAFTAGMKRLNPFFFLFFPMLQYHVGLGVTPGAAVDHGKYDPERVFAAMRAGAACTRDLTEGWDWWEDLPRPLPEVRAKYGLPLTGA